MDISKRSKIRISLFIAAFILSAVLRFVLMGKDFSMGIGNITRGIIVIAWALTVLERIIEKNERFLLIGVAACLTTLNFSQYAKYSCNTVFFSEYPQLWRFFWYFYYVSFIIQPLLTFLIGCCVGVEGDRDIIRKYSFLFFPCTAFVILFMTNDLHQLAFAFRNNGEAFDVDPEYGILYKLLLIWLIALTAAFFVILIKKSSSLNKRIQVLIPFIPIAIGLLYYACHFIGIKFSINGTEIVDFGFMYNVMVVGGLEGCIQTGLIPSNNNYKKLFEGSHFSMLITDDNKKTVYASEGSDTIPTDIIKSEDMRTVIRDGSRITQEKINGGYLYRADNIAYIDNLNYEIAKTNENINARNEYLKSENEIKEQQAHIDAMKALYDKIASTVHLQAEKINKLLDDESDFNNNLPLICFLNAYIKRRSNLELIASEKESISLGELFTSINESADYLNLCGIKAMVFPMANTEVSSETIILCYDFFESIAESVADKATAITIKAAKTQDKLEMRIMTAGTVPEIDEKYLQYTVQNSDESDCITVFTLKGGDLK